MNNSVNYSQLGTAADFITYTNTNTNASNMTIKQQQHQSFYNNGTNFQQQNDIDFHINFQASQPAPPQPQLSQNPQQQQQNLQHSMYNCSMNADYTPYYSQEASGTQHQPNTFEYMPMSIASTPTAISTSNTSSPHTASNSSSSSPSMYQSQNDAGLLKKPRPNIKIETSKRDKSLIKSEELNEEDEDDEDDDEDDEEEDEDEDDDEDEDTDTDDLNSSYFIGSKRANAAKSKAMSKLNCDNDIDNEYEIKHNCLTEDGVYLNTLFNSPSSLSSLSSSANSANSSSNAKEAGRLGYVKNAQKIL